MYVYGFTSIVRQFDNITLMFRFGVYFRVLIVGIIRSDRILSGIKLLILYVPQQPALNKFTVTISKD